MSADNDSDSVSERPMLAPELIQQFSLAGRIAVITGAAGGIGRQAAITFAQAGGDVVIADVSVAGLEETAALVAEVGGTALVVPTDVSNRAAVEALGAAALSAHGRIDVWANVAGIIRYAPITDVTPEDLAAIVGVNQFGTYWGVAAAGRIMAATPSKGGGSIINITSAMVTAPHPFMTLSIAARTALTGVTKAVSKEVVSDNVTINNILPERIDTGRQRQMAELQVQFRGITLEEAYDEMKQTIAAKRLGRPDEVGAACAFLASVHAGYISGENLHLDGGSYDGLI